jgi:hypothetical protein
MRRSNDSVSYIALNFLGFISDSNWFDSQNFEPLQDPASLPPVPNLFPMLLVCSPLCLKKYQFFTSCRAPSRPLHEHLVLVGTPTTEQQGGEGGGGGYFVDCEGNTGGGTPFPVVLCFGHGHYFVVATLEGAPHCQADGLLI